MPTRWGSKGELIAAVEAAKSRGMYVLIDAVLNVSRELVQQSRSLIECLQHKLGADRKETFQAVPVDPDNRLKTVSPVREIEVIPLVHMHGRNKH